VYEIILSLTEKNCIKSPLHLIINKLKCVKKTLSRPRIEKVQLSSFNHLKTQFLQVSDIKIKEDMFLLISLCFYWYLECPRPSCIKRCQGVVKVNIMSSDLIGGYLKFYLNQPIKWVDFRLDSLLADTMLTKLYTTGPYYIKAVHDKHFLNWIYESFFFNLTF
jgi:hypothetical protein